MSTAKTLTTKNLITLFGVSHMAIQNWRKGSSKREPLETVEVKGEPRAVAFSVAGIKAFAKKHGLTMLMTPESLLASTPDVQEARAKASSKKVAAVKPERKPTAAKVFTETLSTKQEPAKEAKAGAVKGKGKIAAPKPSGAKRVKVASSPA